jgi:hypothetical protein
VSVTFRLMEIAEFVDHFVADLGEQAGTQT